MKKILVLSAILGISITGIKSQDTLCLHKALNFPFHRYGISIGNSGEFNGIRINFADKHVTRINGLNLTLWINLSKNQHARVNGISLGLLPAAEVLQPLNIGLIGVGSMNCSRGLSVGGIMVGGDVIGLGLAGLGIFADGYRGRMSGLAVGGLVVSATHSINGVSLGGLGVVTEGDINGLSLAATYIYSNRWIRGVTVTPGYLDANVCKGIVLAGYARSKQMQGISIALFNHTNELRGFQLGILNQAKNNPKGLRMLPFMNMHFGSPRPESREK